MNNIKVKTKRGRDIFFKYRSLLKALSTFYCIFPLSFRITLLNHHRKTKGKLGIGLRYALLKTIAKQCGDNVSVHSDVYLLNPKELSIGNHVSIHPMCYIEAAGGIRIQDDVSIAHGVSLISSNHSFSNLNVPIKDQQIKLGEINIKSNVWLGARCLVLADVTIESGCIIAAGAVVTGITEKNAIYGGVPAKIIRRRN